MEKEKGISRADMISAISASIINAAQKGVNAGQELKIEINPKTGALKAWSVLRVVDSVSDPAREIHIENARKINKEVALGDDLLKDIDPSYLGRIAAQTARQAIMQKIKQFERDRIFDDFKESVGDIVTGTVRRRERGDLVVDIGKAEALLPSKERMPGEDYSPGERIRCLLLKIDSTPRGPELILSRSHPQFIRRLFELEVSEIGEGTVSIEGMARDPGYRTKMAVQTNDPKVDPVGACVGARGARVKTIVRELGGEKIDIVRYYEDPKMMLEEAIKPAIPLNVRIDEKNRRIYFEVSEKDLSIAIGKKGQNAKLTSMLMGWRLDINKETKTDGDFVLRMKRAVAGIHQIPGITDDEAKALVKYGFTTPEAFEGVTLTDLTGLGFEEEQARQILTKVEAYYKGNRST